MGSSRISWHLATLLILLVAVPPAAAQQRIGPQASLLWQAAPHREAGEAAGTGTRAIESRTDGLAIGALVGGVAAMFVGHRLCQAYSAGDNCWNQALWWGVIGGMLGGLIGASGADESQPAGAELSTPAP